MTKPGTWLYCMGDKLGHGRLGYQPCSSEWTLLFTWQLHFVKKQLRCIVASEMKEKKTLHLHCIIV